MQVSLPIHRGRFSFVYIIIGLNTSILLMFRVKVVYETSHVSVRRIISTLVCCIIGYSLYIYEYIHYISPTYLWNHPELSCFFMSFFLSTPCSFSGVTTATPALFSISISAATVATLGVPSWLLEIDSATTITFSSVSVEGLKITSSLPDNDSRFLIFCNSRVYSLRFLIHLDILPSADAIIISDSAEFFSDSAYASDKVNCLFSSVSPFNLALCVFEFNSVLVVSASSTSFTF
mmetsp:Transcript_3118/g.4158  ORF Transcript_3118/g.4158 Transcript_3118/m.4158 type:complete len:234 (-) Transcript_3118:1319-2020(-)